MPLVRVPWTLPQILGPAEIDALTAALRTHRDRAMVAAMVLGGLRRCEVLGLRLGDLRFGERRLFDCARPRPPLTAQRERGCWHARVVAFAWSPWPGGSP